MAKSNPQQRIRSIYQMLFELATGNLSYRYDENIHDDGLDHLFVILNKFAMHMEAALLRHGYVSPRYTYQNLVQLSLVLDHQHIIKNCGTENTDIIGQSPSSLLGKHFTDILSPISSQLYLSHFPFIGNDQSALPLIFLSPNQQVIPRYCAITKLYDGDFLINSISTILQDLVYDLPHLKKVHGEKPRPSEAETMQQLYDYILANLDKPLPTLKHLAKMLKINEYDLKHGFRVCFNTSIHFFYNEERLKRAHVMIVHTDMNLKTIAFANGFLNYNSFFKAFKKRFGYSPGAVKRHIS